MTRNCAQFFHISTRPDSEIQASYLIQLVTVFDCTLMCVVQKVTGFRTRTVLVCCTTAKVILVKYTYQQKNFVLRGVYSF